MDEKVRKIIEWVLLFSLLFLLLVEDGSILSTTIGILIMTAYGLLKIYRIIQNNKERRG